MIKKIIKTQELIAFYSQMENKLSEEFRDEMEKAGGFNPLETLLAIQNNTYVEPASLTKLLRIQKLIGKLESNLKEYKKELWI